MDLGCLCRFMGGLCNGLQRAVRTEYRLMSEDQRQRFHNALLQIKNNGVYDQLARVHSDAVQSGSAHGGPAFHPWHREFIKRFEFALRMVDPSISLPCWDSTLDGVLPTPSDSIFFSQELMGQEDPDGQLRNGRFAPWRTLEGNPFITRRVGQGGACYQESQIQWIWGQRDIALMLGYAFPNAGCPYQVTANLPELTHGNIHIFVGGDMLDPRTSANDPLFYMHHCFVDYIWEGYRLRQQNRQQRETEYPPDNLQCEPTQHFAGTSMLPFNPMNNIDGTSNLYTDNLYIYAERATCQNNCGSNYLFCNRLRGRCSSKVRLGGDCRGFNFGDDVCYNGMCVNGRCVGNQLRADDNEDDIELEIPHLENNIIKIPDQVAYACYNEHECCAIWAYEGECESNINYMNIMCRASCGKCKPDYELKYGCFDRHPHCKLLRNQGLCQKEKLWMEWARNGQCTENSDWMNCNCPISCGNCLPRNFTYGNCSDYYKNCKYWASVGECERNNWMKENCKSSCKTCLRETELGLICKNFQSNSTRFKRNTILNVEEKNTLSIYSKNDENIFKKESSISEIIINSENNKNNN